jgi:addiction module HigA family antidote
MRTSAGCWISKRLSPNNPPHPGEILREFGFEPLGLTVTAAVEALGISRKTLSAILNGRAGINAEMALRLGEAFNTSPESWLHHQIRHDLWLVRRSKKKLKVRKLAA